MKEEETMDHWQPGRISKNQELIMMDGQGLAEVDEFTYLEATVCKEEGAGMKDPKNRLSKARSALVRLKRIWRSKTILRRTKLYKTLVLPVLLYGCETWKVNEGMTEQWMCLITSVYEESYRSSWQDHASTEELLLRKSRYETYEKRSEAA